MPPPDVFIAIRNEHGHYCPMSTCGGRMGWAARKRLEAAGISGRLMALVYTRSCALAGIVQTTGCDEATGTLRLLPGGQQRLDLRTESGAGISVQLTAAALRRSGAYRQARAILESQRAALSATELQQREAALAVQLDILLDELRTCPDEELMRVTELTAAVKG
ncbi:MAG: hypothetical protein K0A93_10995 [Desulfuromonadaceae bacterium]|nr:hypothetical protein [Desulfuromonadaceae bacterium]